MEQNHTIMLNPDLGDEFRVLTASEKFDGDHIGRGWNSTSN